MAQYFHCKTELWHFGLGHVSDIDLLKLAKQGLLGNGTKFKVLKIDNDLKFVSK